MYKCLVIVNMRPKLTLIHKMYEKDKKKDRKKATRDEKHKIEVKGGRNDEKK